MKSLRLSEHFVLAEFERSATTVANHIDNTVPSQYIPALEQLCNIILEPLRAFAGSTHHHQLWLPLQCPQHLGRWCIRIQHTLGEAADIYIPKTAYTDWDDNKAHTDKDIVERWFSWFQSHTDFDQLIMETSNGRDYWIHVSCRANRKKNRHQIFRDMRKK